MTHESENTTSFEVKDDGIYINGERITLNADDWYANASETRTLSEAIPEMVGSRKVFVIDPQYDYHIVETLYAGKEIKPVKTVKVYKDYELYDTADVVSACVGDYVRDIGA